MVVSLLNFMGRALYHKETHIETESRSYPGQAPAKLQRTEKVRVLWKIKGWWQWSG